jgi:hypothetical protein
MEIRKAVRQKARLRLGIVASSGAGKTYSALLIAQGLGGKIGLIDTEHGSGDLYAHLGDYDIINIEAPYTIAKYRAAVNAFESAGYATIIIDSLSHAWAGDGGLLDKQGKIADSGKGNSYTAWRSITPEHNSLIDSMLSSPCHIIATMRAKTEYVMQKNDKGRDMPVKVGLAPIQRDGMDYEFTIVFDLSQEHVASVSKDRTGLFDGQYFKPSKETGETLLTWLEGGIDVPPKPVMPEQSQVDFKAAIDSATTEDEIKEIVASAKKIAQEYKDKPSYEKIVAYAGLRVEKLSLEIS